MKTYTNAITIYRASGREHGQVDLVSFRVRERDTGDPHWFHFTSRDDDEAVTVIDPDSGADDLRSYFGGGHIVAMDAITRTEGTDASPMSIVLSATSDVVRDMIYGYDCRDALVEWHIGESEDNTGLLIDTPSLEFEGFIDVVSKDDAGLNLENDVPADSNFKLTIVDHITVLERGNADLRSYEVGQDRSGDAIYRFVAESNTWDVLWGMKGKKKKNDDVRRGRDDTGPKDSDTYVDTPGGHR